MRGKSRRLRTVVAVAMLVGAGALLAAGAATAAPAGAAAARRTAMTSMPFLDRFSSTNVIASTVPASGPAAGDQNPYGVAVVGRTTGKLTRGDVLVSNFNDTNNHQGTGSSIVDVSPSGKARVFAVVPPPTSTPATGLTTALVALRSGCVIVGSLPAPGGNSSAATAGALTIIDSRGRVVANYTARDINGPWDMTALDRGRTATLFVTNVLNGTVAANGNVVNRGTVVRLQLSIRGHRVPQVVSNRVIATGFAEHTDPNALVVGPTGVGLGSDGTLYVADSDQSRIAAIPRALTRTHPLSGGGVTVAMGGSLMDPLGMAIAPNGHIITANGGDGNIVETTPTGDQVATKTLVPDGAGDLFGLALVPHARGIYFVNDSGSGPGANSLDVFR
jgi:hypothetical protein